MTSGNIGAFEFGGHTYVFQENGTGDLLIQLTGVTNVGGLSTTPGAADLIVIS